ncbi:hypothetical protein N9241_01055, partial [bacterium]|nr:hypothetical protein [bacterium]
MPPLGFIKRCVKALACLALLHHLLFASLSFGNALLAGANPLEPIDRSSPRATLNSFLINANRSWQASISSAGKAQSSLLQDLAAERARSCFDLTLVPPSEREDTAQESAIMLLDIFNRIPMPNLDAVPDLTQLEETGMEAWKIPGTPIVIAKVNEGELTGQWLFAPQVVNRIPSFYELTRGLPVNPGAVIEDGYQLYSSLGGSLIPNEWVLALPAWAQQTYFKQAGWQWLSGAILMVIGVIMAAWIVRLAKLGAHPGNSGLAMFVLAPALLMILSQVCLYLLDAQLNFTGQVLSFLRLLLLLTYYLAATWLVIRGCALAAR